MIKTGEINTSAIAIKDIVKGILLSMIATIILLFAYAIILTYTNVSESTIPIVTIIITAISILVGSQMATLHIKKNGAINGGLVRNRLYTFTLSYFKPCNRKLYSK